jgi:hypothetical protein
MLFERLNLQVSTEIPSSEPLSAGRRVWSRGTRGGIRVLPHREAGLVPQDTWRCQSPLKPGGGVWRRGARGDTGVVPCREVGSGTVGHVVTPEPSRAGGGI